MISLEYKAEALRAKMELFASLPEHEWKYLVSLLSEKNLAENEFFVREGDPVRSVGFVAKGILKDYYLTEDGREFVKEFESEGCFVGPYSGLLTDGKSHFNTVALEATELLVIPLTSMKSLFERHASWEVFGRRLAEFLFLERERRERDLLIKDATERFEAFLLRYGHIANRIPQKEVAAYLGITPVSLSRLRGKARRP